MSIEAIFRKLDSFHSRGQHWSFNSSIALRRPKTRKTILDLEVSKK